MSAEFIGKQIALGIAVEVTRGVPPSSPELWVKSLSNDIYDRAETAEDETSLGVMEDGTGRRTVKKFIQGDFEALLTANLMGFLAYNIYGDVETTTLTSGAYNHKFKVANSSLAPSLAFYSKFGDVKQLATKNCHINTLEIDATPDDYVKINADILGEDKESNSSAPDYSAKDFDFIGKEVTVKVADSAGALSGANKMCVKDLKITFDRGLLDDYCLGRYTPEIFSSKVSIEGSFTKNYENNDFFNMFLNNNSKYMEITIKGEQEIKTGHNPTIKITLNKVMVTDWSKSGGKDDLVTEDVSFKAYYNTTDKKASEMEVINSVEEIKPDVSI